MENLAIKIALGIGMLTGAGFVALILFTGYHLASVYIGFGEGF